MVIFQIYNVSFYAICLLDFLQNCYIGEPIYRFVAKIRTHYSAQVNMLSTFRNLENACYIPLSDTRNYKMSLLYADGYIFRMVYSR